MRIENLLRNGSEVIYVKPFCFECREEKQRMKNQVAVMQYRMMEEDKKANNIDDVAFTQSLKMLDNAYVPVKTPAWKRALGRMIGMPYEY